MRSFKVRGAYNRMSRLTQEQVNVGRVLSVHHLRNISRPGHATRKWSCSSEGLLLRMHVFLPGEVRECLIVPSLSCLAFLQLEKGVICSSAGNHAQAGSGLPHQRVPSGSARSAAAAAAACQVCNYLLDQHDTGFKAAGVLYPACREWPWQRAPSAAAP